jgi:hypothetical protein
MYQATNLIGILHQDVFALRHLHAQVRDSPDNTPPVCQGDVELPRKFSGAHGRRAQNDMAGIVPRVRARDVSGGKIV